MKEIVERWFIHQWPRKLTALLAAVVIWALVSHSITVTRTIPNIPIRVSNIPPNKTIQGLQPGGILSRRLTLTVTGQKSAVEDLSPEDLLVVTDATGKGDQWTLSVTKRNLRSTDPSVDISQAISRVAPVELTIQLTPYVTEEIPIQITRPAGEAPKGYLFLDVWPQRLYQKVSGPEQQVKELKAKGLTLTFDLSKVSKQELDALYERSTQQGEDEVRFFVPEGWKRVSIPFEQGKSVPLNDPEAAFLHLDFLKREVLPLDTELPVTVFYPLNTSETLNPIHHPLDTEGPVATKNGIYVFTPPLYVGSVSRLFLDIVRHRIEITLVAVTDSDPLPWAVEFIDPTQLEEAYLRASLAQLTPEQQQQLSPKQRETYLRERFRNYMREFNLVTEDKAPLSLTARLEQGSIIVEEP